MKYYLIKLHREPTKFTRIKEDTFVEITPDDYGLILDALYEQAIHHEKDTDCYYGSDHYITSYSRALVTVAKKFERIFKDEK